MHCRDCELAPSIHIQGIPLCSNHAQQWAEKMELEKPDRPVLSLKLKTPAHSGVHSHTPRHYK